MSKTATERNRFESSLKIDGDLLLGPSDDRRIRLMILLLEITAESMPHALTMYTQFDVVASDATDRVGNITVQTTVELGGRNVA